MYNPEKVASAVAIAGGFLGKESELNAKLRETYNADLSALPANKVGAAGGGAAAEASEAPSPAPAPGNASADKVTAAANVKSSAEQKKVESTVSLIARERGSVLRRERNRIYIRMCQHREVGKAI
jgi:hypothetical protein